MEEINKCDKCGEKDLSKNLVWIDAEDFNPLKKDGFNKEKYENALSFGFSALCEDCYFSECCN